MATTTVPSSWADLPDNVARCAVFIVKGMVDKEDFAGALVVWCRLALGLTDAVQISKHVRGDHDIKEFGVHYTRKVLRQFYAELVETYTHMYGGSISTAKSTTYNFGKMYD